MKTGDWVAIGVVLFMLGSVGLVIWGAIESKKQQTQDCIIRVTAMGGVWDEQLSGVYYLSCPEYEKAIRYQRALNR